MLYAMRWDSSKSSHLKIADGVYHWRLSFEPELVRNVNGSRTEESHRLVREMKLETLALR
jgi:hypothetical protein